MVHGDLMLCSVCEEHVADSLMVCSVAKYMLCTLKPLRRRPGHGVQAVLQGRQSFVPVQGFMVDQQTENKDKLPTVPGFVLPACADGLLSLELGSLGNKVCGSSHMQPCAGVLRPHMLFLGLDRSRSSARTCRVGVFAHFWIDNRTGLDLVFRDLDVPYSCYALAPLLCECVGCIQYCLHACVLESCIKTGG